MDSTFKVFDFHRIFVGEAPPIFLLEIVFRTLIMYAYTYFFYAFLAKEAWGSFQC